MISTRKLIVAKYLLSVIVMVKCQKELQEENSLLSELKDVYDTMEQNQNKLKQIIDEVSHKGNAGCLCVPFYLCDNGRVNTKGNGLIELRAGVNPCKNQLHICCDTPKEMHDPTTPRESSDENWSENSRCGYGNQIMNANSDNTNEVSSRFGEFPWTTMILTNQTRYQCVGSLIHPRVVLTAAHCLNPEDNNYTVRAGEWDATNTDESYPYQVQNVKEVVRYPNYDGTTHEYDAALLLLEDAFTLDQNNINTICLQKPELLDLNNCYGSGWGLDTILGGYQKVMKKVAYSVIPNTVCERKLRSTRLGRLYQLHPSFVCAEGKAGRELCTGDGGAPLVCSSRTDPEKFFQVGIAVWGLGCEAESPSVFASVSVIHDWISLQLGAWGLATELVTSQHPVHFNRFID